MEIAAYTAAGSLTHSYMAQVAEVLGNYIESGDDINFTVQELTGGGGAVAANYTYNTQPDGTLMAYGDLQTLASNIFVEPEIVNYDLAEFDYVSQIRQTTTAIVVNPRTTDVEEHWDWTWDDLIENAEDLRIASCGSQHRMSAVTRALFNHPDLDAEVLENNLIFYGCGGEARPAVERGEVDVFLPGFSSAWGTPEFYKTQFVITDSGDEGYYNDLMGVTDGQATTLDEAQETFPQEVIDLMKVVASTHQVTYLPPDVPASIYDRWVEGMAATLDSSEMDEFVESVDDAFAFNPMTGQELQELTDTYVSTLQENEEDIITLFSG